MTGVALPASVQPERRELRIADVVLPFGERSGVIRAYLREKAAFAERTGAFQHHVVVAGLAEPRALRATLCAIEPDLLLLHDPWSGRRGGCLQAFLAFIRHVYPAAEAVIAVVAPTVDGRRERTVPLRFGVDPAFRPGPAAQQRRHVLYAGRLGGNRGLLDLIEVTARSREPWRLHLVGTGPARRILSARARRLGISERVLFSLRVGDRRRLARLFAEASCVVMPGPCRPASLLALEAAASGANVVTCGTDPSVRLVGKLAETFPCGDRQALGQAIERARLRRPDLHAAAALSEAHSWDRVFAAELRDLRGICPSAFGGRRRAA
jgi:alpha-1,6-mannosyltransferase